MGIVGDGRGSAADDVDQLSNLMLAHADDVSIELVGVAASGHERQQRAPARGHGGGDAGTHRICAQCLPLAFQFLDRLEQAHFFLREFGDRGGGLSGEGRLLGIERRRQGARKLDLAIQ